MSRLIVIFLLVFVSRTSCSDAANPFKKFLNGGGMMAADESQGGSNCDNALAKSLVLANDQKTQLEIERDEARSSHIAALETIASVSTELESTKELLTGRIVELEQSRVALEETAASQRESSQEELKAAVESSQEREQTMLVEFDKKLEESIKLWTAKTAALDDEHAKRIAVVQAESQAAHEQVQSELKAQIALLEKAVATMGEEHKRQLQALQQEASTTVQNIGLELNKTHGDLQAELETMRKQAEEERLEIIRIKDEETSRLIKDYNSQASKLQEEHDQIVLELKQATEILEKSAVERLEAREEELETLMNKLKHDSMTLLEETQRSHDLEMMKALKSLSKTEKEVSLLNAEAIELQRKYDSASEEIEDWRNLYNTRSYCNLTHIAEDAAAIMTSASSFAASQLLIVAAEASKHLVVAVDSASEQLLVVSKAASEQLPVATKSASEHFTIVSGKIGKSCVPHIERIRSWYRSHLKQQLENHVLPFFDEHVNPAVIEATKHFTMVRKELSKTARSSHRHAIVVIVDSCPKVKKHLRQMKLHRSIQIFVRDSCRDPKGTIDRSLITLAILFVIIFRGALWRTFWFWVKLPFQIMWYMSPLPFIYPSTHKRAHQVTDGISGDDNNDFSAETNDDGPGEANEEMEMPNDDLDGAPDDDDDTVPSAISAIEKDLVGPSQ